MQLSDSETESDKFSTVHPSKIVVAQVTTSSEEEEEGMDLKQRTGLRGLMANRNKGSTLKEIPKTQVPPNLPPPPPLPIDHGLHANLNLRRKRSVEDQEEGEVAPRKGAKQQKKAKDPQDKRAKSVESWDEVEVPQTWAPRLEMEGAPIPWDATIWES